VGHADHPRPWVTRGRTKRVELLQVDIAQPGLLLQLAAGRLVEALLHADEAAGDRPAPLEGRVAPPDEQHAQLRPIGWWRAVGVLAIVHRVKTTKHPEDHHVDRDGRAVVPGGSAAGLTVPRHGFLTAVSVAITLSISSCAQMCKSSTAPARELRLTCRGRACIFPMRPLGAGTLKAEERGTPTGYSRSERCSVRAPRSRMPSEHDGSPVVGSGAVMESLILAQDKRWRRT